MDINKLVKKLEKQPDFEVVKELINSSNKQELNIKLKNGNINLMLTMTGYCLDKYENQNATYKIDNMIALYGLTNENRLFKILINSNTNKNYDCNFTTEVLLRVLLNNTIDKNKTIEEFYQELKKAYEESTKQDLGNDKLRWVEVTLEFENNKSQIKNTEGANRNGR